METKTEIADWSGKVYQGLGDLYDKLRQGEFLEYTEDLNDDELLRLATYAWSNGWSLVPEDLVVLIAVEQEAYWGEYSSEAEFAEEKSIELGMLDEEGTKNLVIDWQATYNYTWQYDFFNYEVIDLEGNYRRFFWNNNV